MGLILYPGYESVVLLALLKPFFTVTAYPFYLFHLFLLEGEALEVCVLGCVQLG